MNSEESQCQERPPPETLARAGPKAGDRVGVEADGVKAAGIEPRHARADTRKRCGERQDAFAGVGAADAEVVHAAGAAEAHLAGGVEAVVAQPVVPWRCAPAGVALGVAR